jgi:hypothetical protein
VLLVFAEKKAVHHQKVKTGSSKEGEYPKDKCRKKVNVKWRAGFGDKGGYLNV